MTGMKRLHSLLLLMLLMTAGAQELRIGVILPFTSKSGNEWRQVITGVERSINLHASPVMRNVRIITADDGGSPARAVSLARQLVRDNDVHVLICCSDPATTAALQPVAGELQVLTLSLSRAPDLPGSSQLKSVQPIVLSSLRAQGLGACSHEGELTLMVCVGPEAEEIEAACRAGALEASMPVMRVVTFRRR